MKKYFSLMFAASLVLSTNLLGQLRTPSASPAATVMQTVGLTQVTVEYSRPSMRGRAIFGEDGLVPFGKVWRTGANSATKIEFSEDVKVAEHDLKAGAYAVLSVPGAEEWEVMFFPYESSNWGSYPEKTPAATVKVTASSTSSAYETFTIELAHLSNDGAHLVMKWENTKIAIPVTVHTQKQVASSFEKMMAGPSNGEYYNYGVYLAETGGDLNKALEYVQKVTKTDNPMYWQKRQESLILAKLGKNVEAIAAAKVSLELAKKAGSEDYIRMNEKSIAEWSN
jgi:hypothetical protein